MFESSLIRIKKNENSKHLAAIYGIRPPPETVPVPLPTIAIPVVSTLGPGAPPRKETLLSTHESADDYRRTYKANVIIFHVLNTNINISNSHRNIRAASIAN